MSPRCIFDLLISFSAKYDLADPDFPGMLALVPLRYKRRPPYIFFSIEGIEVVRTTTSSLRIVSTRIREYIFSVGREETREGERKCIVFLEG